MDFRISRSSVNGLDEAEYFWALIEPMWPDTSLESLEAEMEHVASTTPGQRALYVVTLFVREVDNGGLDQFFSNSSGMYATEVHEALRLLGAATHAAAFEVAMRVFPCARVPWDREGRQALLESVSKDRRRAVFEPLEEVLSGEEGYWAFFRRYVDAHPSEFFLDSSVPPK